MRLHTRWWRRSREFWRVSSWPGARLLWDNDPRNLAGLSEPDAYSHHLPQNLGDAVESSDQGHYFQPRFFWPQRFPPSAIFIPPPILPAILSGKAFPTQSPTVL